MEQNIEPNVETAIETDTQAQTDATESSNQAQADVTAAVQAAGGSGTNMGTASVDPSTGFDTIVIDTAPVAAGPVVDVIVGIGMMLGIVVQTITAPTTVATGMMPNPTSIANKVAQLVTAGFALALAIDTVLQSIENGTFDASGTTGSGSAGERER